MIRSYLNQTKLNLTEIVHGCSMMELEDAFQSKLISDYTDDGWVLINEGKWIPHKQWKELYSNAKSK